MSPTLTLYSKPECHLCEDARQLAEELQPEFGFVIEEVDITRDAQLFARYRYEIPVVVLDGVEIARGRIGERDLLEPLRRLTSG